MSARPMAETRFFADPTARADYLDWITEDEKAARTVAMLEGIRLDHGPAWALVASVWCEVGKKNRPHVAVREWRQRLAEEINTAMEAG